MAAPCSAKYSHCPSALLDLGPRLHDWLAHLAHGRYGERVVLVAQASRHGAQEFRALLERFQAPRPCGARGRVEPRVDLRRIHRGYALDHVAGGGIDRDDHIVWYAQGPDGPA